MQRHALRALLLAALLALAGCLGGPGAPGPSPTASPTPMESPTPTESPPPGVSPEEPTSPPASPESSEPDRGTDFPDGPKEPPERPATLNRTTAAEYVETYEYRYAYNALWMGEYSEVSLDCEVRSVAEASEGYEVVVACTGYSNTGGPATGTATATVVHADWFTQVYRYHVTEDSLTGYAVERGG